MLYHYTSFEAFKSILRDAESTAQMCFWATRYDCFADTDEFKLGIETTRRLLPEVEKELQPDRRIAELFNWNEIKGNINIPCPYVVSFSSRPDNDYMWGHYAGNDGVVMAVDDSQNVEVYDVPVVSLASCVYVDDNSEAQLAEKLRVEYSNIAYKFLGGPKKEMAMKWLQNYPQSFVKLIAMGLLSLMVPRVKGAKNYKKEEETRLIISMPKREYYKLIEEYDGHDDLLESMGISPLKLKHCIENELLRKREDGTEVYYREIHLPIRVLKGVYVRSEKRKEMVESFMSDMGMSIEVVQM